MLLPFHLPALGNRNAFTGGPAVLADPERAVAPVAALLAHGSVVLLCDCADPARGHRSLAATFLAERLAGEVVHIPSPPRQRRDDGGQLGLPGLEGREHSALQHRSDGFVIELTYRPDEDWHKNIIVAGASLYRREGSSRRSEAARHG